MSNDRQIEGWYAVRTRSNFEKRVSGELTQKGFETYCPVFKEIHAWADRKKLVEKPVFPGYTFIRFSPLPQSWLAVVKTSGVVKILGVDGQLERIPDSELDRIRQLLEAGADVGAHPFIEAGSRVRIRRGALKNVEGLLVRMKNSARVVLSISLLRQSISAEVDLRDVELVRKRQPHPSNSEAA